jgi:serine protease Do
LGSGFTPDPHEVPIVSGGSVDVAALNLGTDCTGYAASSPDYRLEWSGGGSRLRFYFDPVVAGEDATLIINDAEGNWICNDDFSGLNPVVDIANPTEGQYDIWVGSFTSDDFLDGVLVITELDLLPEDGSGSGGLDLTQEANFGEVALQAGFTPDPHQVEIVSGGSVDVSSGGYGSGCTGYATSAPDFRLDWSGSATSLRIYFTADDWPRGRRGPG